MADKVPLKLVDNGSGVGSLVEFATTDTVPVSNLAKAVSVALAALVAGTNTVIGTSDTIITALQNLQAQVTQGSLLETGSGYIDGIIPTAPSTTSISVSAGSAYILSAGANLVVPATLTLSSLSLTANTWYYLYLYNNAGVAAIELVTTAPSTVYSGTARTKTGDTTRRFIMAVRAATAGAIRPFLWDASYVNYTDLANTYPSLSGALATTVTVFSVAAAVPFITQRYLFQVYGAIGATLTIGLAASTTSLFSCATSSRFTGQSICDSSQNLFYSHNGTVTGGSTLDVRGYGSDR